MRRSIWPRTAAIGGRACRRKSRAADGAPSGTGGVLAEPGAWDGRRRSDGPRSANRRPRMRPGVETPQCACAILTADCLPVLICDRAGTVVAAAHCGWRGLAGGVLDELVRRLPVRAGDLLAWFGPAIGPARYQIGDDVREALLARLDCSVVDTAAATVGRSRQMAGRSVCDCAPPAQCAWRIGYLWRRVLHAQRREVLFVPSRRRDGSDGVADLVVGRGLTSAVALATAVRARSTPWDRSRCSWR